MQQEAQVRGGSTPWSSLFNALGITQIAAWGASLRILASDAIGWPPCCKRPIASCSGGGTLEAG
jgi:hypothetical protein